MTKTNEEIYKLAMDFIINSKHGTDEETVVLTHEIKDLAFEQVEFFLGVVSGFICGVMDFSLVGKLEEPILKEFLNQRYLTLKDEGAFEN